ncbi:MAG: transposase, partial [Chloroflexi bacterium]|nr:transposase [Chloroflexota bacterium]
MGASSSITPCWSTARAEITFTRGRAYRKNDQCYVEQKNGSIVRQIVGYDRFEGEVAYHQLAELYGTLRLYVNFFQPSLKLLLKRRDGSQVYRRYDAARTPFQRLLTADILDTATRARLGARYEALDPVQALRRLQQLQEALWRHAIASAPATPAPT